MLCNVKWTYTSRHDRWLTALMDNDVETVRSYLTQSDNGGRYVLMEGWISEGSVWDCWQCKESQEEKIMAVQRAWSLAAVCGSCEVIGELYQAGIDVLQADEFGNNVMHTIIIHASRHSDCEDRYLKVFNYISSLLPEQKFQELVLNQNTSGLRCVELAAYLQTFLLMNAIFDSPVYRKKHVQCGTLCVDYYDVTDYEGHFASRSWTNSPLYLLAFLRNTKLQDTNTKKSLTSGVIGRWMTSRKKVFLPIFAVLALMRLLIVFLIFFPARLYGPPNPESKVCGPIIWFSPKTQQATLIFLVLFKATSLLYELVVFMKWQRTDTSWYKLYTLREGDVVARYYFHVSIHSLYSITILVLSLNRLSWHFWDKSMPVYPMNVLFICNVIGSIWSILYIIQLFPIIGKYVTATERMVISLAKFSFLVFAFIWPFAAIFPRFIASTENGICPQEFNSTTSLFYTSFLLIINMVDLRDFDATSEESLWLLHVIYFVFIAVLLLNFLIAIFSDTYTEVAGNYSVVNTIQWMCVFASVDYRLPRFMCPIIMALKRKYFTVCEDRIYIRNFKSRSIVDNKRFNWKCSVTRGVQVGYCDDVMNIYCSICISMYI